jgi:hypothetical protein
MDKFPRTNQSLPFLENSDQEPTVARMKKIVSSLTPGQYPEEIVNVVL